MVTSIRYFIYLLISVTILMQFVACSSDEHDALTDDTQVYKVTYRLNTLRSSDANALTEEAMKDILLIIVKADGEIEELITTNFTSLQEEYTVDVQLTAGKKKIYGFANLTPQMKTQAGLSALLVGGIMPDMSGAVLSISNGYKIDEANNQYLPMSNTSDIVVTNVSGQSFSLELIRLVSKMRFKFKNESGKSITFNSLTISPLTDSPVYLMPQTGDAPVFPSGHTQSDFVYTFPNATTLADGQQIEYITYVNESQVEGNGWFQIRLNTQTEGAPLSDERFSLTELRYINRNDYIDIPIILTDYQLKLDVRSYPPIGGYPPTVVYDNDGYHITFAGGGPFEIKLTMIRLSDNTEVLLSDSDWNFTYTNAPPTFFDAPPILQNSEIYGVINPLSRGSVLFTISAQISTSANVQRVMSSKVYINQN